jgi:hypothetical protein
MLRVLCCHVLQEEEMAQKLRELATSAPKGPRKPQVDHLGRAAAVGGRKTSVARVSKLGHRSILGPQIRCCCCCYCCWKGSQLLLCWDRCSDAEQCQHWDRSCAHMPWCEQPSGWASWLLIPLATAWHDGLVQPCLVSVPRAACRCSSGRGKAASW